MLLSKSTSTGWPNTSRKPCREYSHSALRQTIGGCRLSRRANLEWQRGQQMICVRASIPMSFGGTSKAADSSFAPIAGGHGSSRVRSRTVAGWLEETDSGEVASNDRQISPSTEQERQQPAWVDSGSSIGAVVFMAPNTLTFGFSLASEVFITAHGPLKEEKR